MALNTQEIFDVVSSKYGASASSEPFTQWFFLALNRTLGDLASDRVGISCDVPTDLDTEIDLDDGYLGVVIDGLFKYIRESGMWGNEEIDVLEVRYARSLRQAHTLYASTQTIYTMGHGAEAGSEES